MKAEIDYTGGNIAEFYSFKNLIQGRHSESTLKFFTRIERRTVLGVDRDMKIGELNPIDCS